MRMVKGEVMSDLQAVLDKRLEDLKARRSSKAVRGKASGSMQFQVSANAMVISPGVVSEEEGLKRGLRQSLRDAGILDANGRIIQREIG